MTTPDTTPLDPTPPTPDRLLASAYDMVAEGLSREPITETDSRLIGRELARRLRAELPEGWKASWAWSQGDQHSLQVTPPKVGWVVDFNVPRAE